MTTFFLHIKGIVQGVGFRPYVYNFFVNRGLCGTVKNSSRGVEIYFNASGTAEADKLSEEIVKYAPPLSHITEFDLKESDFTSYKDFSIISSTDDNGLTLVSPDVAICEDCSRELFDETDRRFRYPFINCTNCGPRYSIIKSIPYDRSKTTMAEFEMCPECVEEYKDPKDRRFHAQPDACGECGPNVYSVCEEGEESLREIVTEINDGGIVAVKGLGGYHLICDACSDEAVKKLKTLKNRGDKPLAVMCLNAETLEKYRALDRQERNLLTSPSAPITILKWADNHLSGEINTYSDEIGIMLAYTPLHKIILNDIKSDFVVATSGNIKDEPLCADEKEAEESLARFTDKFLHHNRKIHSRVDDSVARVVDGAPYVLRRARGFAPYPVMLPVSSEKVIFGAGAHLKSTVSISAGEYAFVSQYLGDLDNQKTADFYDETVKNLKNLYNIEPEVAVCDLHPDYYSSKYASNFKEVYKVQHHHAHMYSCMAENGLTGDCIGVIFDGTGLGEDGKIWGGEVFLRKDGKLERVTHLDYVPQPGFDSAAKNPVRMLVSYMEKAGIYDKYKGLFLSSLKEESELNFVREMTAKNINCIDTSSMGRLFEAVGAAVCGVKKNSYEAQAAVRLEAMVHNSSEAYCLPVSKKNMNPLILIDQVLNDLFNKTEPELVATKFHNSIVNMIVNICNDLYVETGVSDIVLSGGVFQNNYILNKTIVDLRSIDLNPNIHSRVPSNDSSVSLGQIYKYLLD